MLHITIPSIEMYDEENNEFIYEPECTLMLEHSLVSISKWESKWHKAFLGKQEKTREETLDYIRCMALTEYDPAIFERLSEENIIQIDEYISNPMTATTITGEPKGKNNSEVITSELIYYWMIALGIPPEYQRWHLNRLLTLVKVCNVKNSPPSKMSKRDIMAQNRALNAARRKQLNSKG